MFGGPRTLGGEIMMTTQEIKQAVTRFMDGEFLLNIKHGGENAGDVTPGGWFDEWSELHNELCEALSDSGLTHYDQYRIHKALNAENFFCNPMMYEDPDRYDAEQDWIHNPEAFEQMQKDWQKDWKQQQQDWADVDIIQAIRDRQEKS